MSAEAAPPTVFAGQRRAYDAVCALVGGFTEHADALRAWRVRPPAGLLLYGPPGTGKTHVVRAAAAAFGLPLLVLQGSGGGGGADELCARLRTTFARAEAEAEAATIARGQATPALLFMDELDTLCPKRSDASSSGDDRRAVAQLLTLLDGVTPRQRVIAVAATNRAHGIDGAPRSDPGHARRAPVPRCSTPHASFLCFPPWQRPCAAPGVWSGRCHWRCRRARSGSRRCRHAARKWPWPPTWTSRR